MKIKTEDRFKIMQIIAWALCIILLLDAAMTTITYFISIGKANAAKTLPLGIDFYAYRQYSFAHYTFLVGYKVIIYCTRAYIAFLITGILGKLNIAKPFNEDVVKLTQKISYAIVCVWFVSMVHNIHEGILERCCGLVANYISIDSIFLAFIVGILVQMFKRGVEFQSENELTV